MELGLIITSVVLGIALILTILNCLKTKKKFKSELEEKSKESDKLHSDLNRYNGIVSIEKEIENKNSELAELQKTAKSFNESINDLQTLNSELDKLKNTKEIEEKELNEIQNKASNLNDRYTNAKSIFKELERDIKLYRNDLEFVELGIYEPIFDYETSEKYKEQLTNIRTKQKQLIKGGNACICNTSWHVGNSRKQGEIMTRRYINLTLRAFNGECDTLISKVRWNNVKRFEERITKAFNAINKLGKSNDVHITDKYLKLKLDELHLAYELEHKKQQEKEEQRAIREEQREEERAQREFEKAKKEAELEEKRFQKALERAQKELGLVSGEELEKLNTQIAELQKNLQEAHEAKERAISRAQETKSGHVYIISNIGSFGENIYKIGMTRRLEPMDRVKELGDASVPFRFDLHALIFTENAPELENLLQKEFDDRRINKVNYRKEYFRVTLDEIQQVIEEKYEKEVEFIKVPEAQEYRETKSIIKQLEQAKQEQIENEIEKYPDSLF
ncbi:DUF4041 domain-containing protein [Winogradskyella tangerina]|uniref:DUF4041 domain-containing protein n=1 Tax=Winogradskyella tangerina TaxID=2023240 RepID=UPI000DBE5565|nr:DUF4041 domain-containing protein [Winogradskyella tangerina]